MLPRESRVFNKIQPATQWGWQETFLNNISYWLELLVWQNSAPATGPAKIAKHNSEKPVPYLPEFMPKPETKNIKKDTISADVDEIKDILSRPRN